MRVFSLAAAVGLLMCSVVFGEAKTPRAIVESGFNAYTLNRTDDAVRTWLTSGPYASSRVKDDYVRRMKRIEDLYGKYKAFHVIKTVTVSETCTIIYAQADYTSGPLFMRFLTYQGDKGWSIIAINLNTDIARVWPETIYGMPDEEEMQ